MTDHTPTPWHTDEPEEERNTLTRILSADVIMLVHAHSYPKYSTKHPDADTRRANAAFIVKAVNNHDALVSFAEYVLEMDRDSNAPLFAKARAVLANVGGEIKP